MSCKSKFYVCRRAGPFLCDHIFEGVRKKMLRNGVMSYPELYPPINEQHKDFIPPANLQQMYMNTDNVELVTYHRGYAPEDLKLILSPLEMVLKGCRAALAEGDDQVYLVKRYGNFKRIINPEKATFVMSKEGVVLARAYWRCYNELADDCLKNCCEEGQHVKKHV